MEGSVEVRDTTLLPLATDVTPLASRRARCAGRRAVPVRGREEGGEGGKQEGGVVTTTKTETRTKLKKPRLYKVLLHNDDYTTREFVVMVLRTIFNKSEPEAVRIMLHVHHNGIGVAGLYTHEVAETKGAQVTSLARANEFPLLVTMEPE